MSVPEKMVSPIIFTPSDQIVRKARMIFHQNRNSSGYTLLEILLVIGIGALITLALAPTFSGLITERKFRSAADLILECAAKNRIEAKKQGKLLSLTFGKNEIKSEVQLDGKKVVLLPKDMTLFLRNNSDKWKLAQGQTWKFFSDGLVAPVSLRLEHGSSWLEIDIDVLTARSAGERFSF